MIEAVVALAVVAIVLAAIGSLVAMNTRGVQNLEQRVALMETARMIAASIPRGGDFPADELGGEIAGHRWQMRVSPFFGDVPPVAEARFIPLRIELRVQSPSGAMVSLETVRLQSRSGG
jgi:general secretion pathway protein I